MKTELELQKEFIENPELKEQLDQINKKMQFELEFFRQEMKPLKNEKQQLLERLSELK